ncbi:MAG: hypothetical protein ABSB88_02630 [Bryobacteraceae bacterium]|jgi:Spy/CpxP family protein refolding chaperone
MANTKLSAFFSLLLVFLSGVVVGGFAYHVYSTTAAVARSNPKGPEEKRDPEAIRKHNIDEMTQAVHLDPQQVGQLEKIYDHTREQFDQVFQKRDAEAHAIYDDQVAQVKAMLRPDQVPLYEAFHAKHEAERKARKKGPGGGRK